MPRWHKVLYTDVSLSFSVLERGYLAVLSKIVMRVRKKRPRRLARKWKQRQGRSEDTATIPWSSWRAQWVQEREKQRLGKQRKCMAILRNDHTSRSSNSFSECFAIYKETLLSLLLHMDDRPKAFAMPTNTNSHVSVQSKVIEIRTYACELVIIGFLNTSAREF